MQVLKSLLLVSGWLRPPTESSVSVGVRVLPQGYWYTVLYSTVVLLLCLLVCLVGAHIYSRTAFVILLVITVTLLSIFVSSLAVKPHDFIITHQLSPNQSVRYNASYTGYSATTLRNNLGRKRRSSFCWPETSRRRLKDFLSSLLAAGYALDYSTNSVMSFATVFAVMFTSCTGIMAGANMSGLDSAPQPSNCYNVIDL